MRDTIRFSLFVLLLTACAGAALADRPVDRTVSLEPGGTVSVELIAGSLRFVESAGDQVRITGSIEDDVEELEIDASGRQVSIEVRLPDGHKDIRRAGARLEIGVPRGTTIEVETVSAEVDIEAVGGAVDVEVVNGTVTIEGDVTEADVAVVSGDIRVDSAAALREGSFETVSGNIDFRGDLAPGGRFSFESLSGNVILRLPPSAGAEFRVETFSGDIVNELGPPAQKSGDFLPSKSLRFTLGGGGAKVSVESFSGNVKLLRQ